MKAARQRSMLWWLLLPILSLIPLTANPEPVGAESCPPGWLPETGTISNITLFCYSIDLEVGDAVFVKAHADAVGQYARHPDDPADLFPTPGSLTGDLNGNDNPEFLKKSVRDHLFDYQPAGAVMVINGTFYECTGEVAPPSNWDPGCGGVSALAFPTFREGNWVVNGGVNLTNSRRCFAWGPGYEPRRHPWTSQQTRWQFVQANADECGDGDPYHRVVGLWQTAGGSNPNLRTYIARDLQGASPDDLCFLVGGYITVQEAVDIIETTFGCNMALQLDGGNSSQLSYVSPATGTVISPIRGDTIFDRKVPHYFVIFG